MIIIFNISGLLLGAAGVLVGIVIALLSGWLSLGVLALAVAWFGLGFYWRRSSPEPEKKRAWPALFFIPLPFAAVPLALLALPMLLVEWGARNQPDDPRAPQLKADERTLDSTLVGGDIALSRSILDGLQVMTVEDAEADAYHVFSRKQGEAVLVLVKVPNLSDYENSARQQLLDMITAIVKADPESTGKRLYIGVKGKFVYGAVQLPSGKAIIRGVIGEDDLYAFYDESSASGDETTARRDDPSPEDLPVVSPPPKQDVSRASNDVAVPRNTTEATVAEAESMVGDNATLGDYAGPGTVEPTGLAITSDTSLVAGMIVQARWHSSWYPATILDIDGDSILIEWNGWDMQESLPRKRLAFAPPEIPQPEGGSVETLAGR